MSKKFLFILFIGLVLRILFIGNTGFLADISFWKSWGLAAADHGVVWASLNTNTNYPPAFLYVLWLMGKAYSLIGDPHNFNNFWRQNNFGFLAVSKSVAIISDVAIAWLIYWFFSQKEKLKQLGAEIIEKNSRVYSILPLLLSSAFFLNPIVILDSSIWGQVESFGILFTLVAIILLFYRRPHLATILFTTGTMMKLQNIIFIPIYFIFIWRYFDINTMIKSVAMSVATFFFLNLPFIWEHQMNQVLYLLTVNGDYFPWLSLNAHNLWWIVAKGHGMPATDRLTILGILNAKTVGLILFSSFYLLSTILVFLKPTARNFLLSLSLGIFAFFLFTTQSHERYSYPVIVLLLFLYPFLEISNIKYQKYNFRGLFGNGKYFWIIYLLLTFTIFFNMHYGLIINYPQNGFQLLTRLTTVPMTIFNSFFLILLFFLLLPYIFSQISYLYFVMSSFFIVVCLIILNIPYIFGKPISLTLFKPVLIKQDYGVLQVNQSVNSSAGFKSWSRLSNNYLFYRKGFGTHANSNLVFDIDKKFTSFSTDFGIDTEAATPASSVFIIYGDTKKLFESKRMGRFDYPNHVNLNITGVKFLGLMVTDAGDGINSDHADWLNPVLYK
ncbi:NPCBM/NEW2 domain-containing protein [Candidatus Gottesmanbacteria bacterium]|nr:NPCBM/NEW2 domain-containing protein [Candidatus Gottesmanbacteria bacterium]